MCFAIGGRVVCAKPTISQFPRFVRPSYILAFGYCAMDATTSGYNTWKALEMTNNRAESGRSKELQTVAATVDSLIWQSKFRQLNTAAFTNEIYSLCQCRYSRSSNQRHCPLVPICDDKNGHCPDDRENLASYRSRAFLHPFHRDTY